MEARFQQFIREEAVGGALQLRGLVSFQPALRRTDTGLELIIASTWNGFDDLTATGMDLDSPLIMPGAAPMLEGGHSEHYELVIGEARTMPLREAKLRLTRIPIRTGAEAQYYEAVRKWSDRLLDDGGMVAFTLGRRVVGRQDEIVAVQVWEDEDALRHAAGSMVERPMGETELASFWAANPAIEHFDALTATEPHANAPAILLADDDRRYVHATPAAVALSGHPLARLLTMRVEDVARAAEREAVAEAWSQFLANGSMDGPYVLERADGSEVHVRFAARANTPWPGSHASLLVPAGADSGGGADLDVDAALVDAGLVARYALPGS
ncbi:MAG: PAS domain-containing protein [Chloroflexota bacterium]